MSLPRFSVQRPVLTTMATLIVVVIGAVAMTRLPIDLLPDVEMPTLTVRTQYEDASPEVIERQVTEVVEQVVASVPGIEEITSTSAEGVSNVRITFTWGTDLDAAANDLRDRLDTELDELPEDASRPQLRKFDIAVFPVVILGIGSSLNPIELTELVEHQVLYRLAQLPGVAQVDIFGGYEREVRVSLSPDRVKALGLPLDRVLDALRAANVDLPAGKIERGRYEVTLRAPAEFTDLDQIRGTVVAMRDGAPVTIAQIGTVQDTHRKITRIVRVNGQRGIRIGIRKQADANTVEVASRVLAEVEELNRELPQIKVVPVINQGNFIERSIANVTRSVLYGGGLAVLVLFLFLRDLRSTAVIALAIPISVIATFALIFFGGLTLNLMTLGGLALGVGMMVDSSIVVLENVFRRREEEGLGAREAAVGGAEEVAGAIVASTITTLVIFLPLIFVRGMAGVLFSSLAFVIAFSLICSLLVALSLVPVMTSRMLGQARELSAPAAQGVMGRVQAGFGGLTAAYRDLLRLVVRHPFVTVALAAAALGASLLLLPRIGTELLPPSDEGEVRVTGTMEIGTRLDLLDQQTRIMEGIVLPAVPECISWVSSVGASGWRPEHASQGELRLSLSPATQRKRPNTEIAADLRKRLAGEVPGMRISTRAPQGQFLLNRIIGGQEGLTVEVRGFDLATLDLLAAQAAAAIVEVPGITDVEVTREAGMPQEMIQVDRDKAADLGLSVRQVAEALETAVAGTRAGDYRTEGDAYRILVQLADAQKLSLDEILDLTLGTAGGRQVALRNILRVQSGRGPLVIDRKDQERLVTVTANTADRDLGSIARDVEERLHLIPRPAGYELRVAGSFEEQSRAFRELLVSLLLAVVLVYMVLASQYESLRDPLVVMFSVPVAAIGVLVILFVTRTTLNLQSYIGCIMLGGIVVNNAILLVDQAGQLRRRDGLPTSEAICEAGRRRLRPILMTTLTTILGLLPLALGIGEGADAQAPLARAVIGGLTASTAITLLLIPAVYRIFHPDRASPSPPPL